MKNIGILGGTSWESTIEYYRLINEMVKENLGGLHSGSIYLHSFDFAPLEELMRTDKWDELGDLMAEQASRLEAAGADCMLLASNTTHLVAPRVSEVLNIPVLHIADSVGRAARELGAQKVGLLGTSFTMEKDLYQSRLKQEHGLTVLAPDAPERREINRVIFEELCLGKINNDSAEKCLAMVEELAAKGAQAVVLGCTELPLLIKQDKTKVPLLDSTELHARDAVRFALG
ncbi:aspartate/glutamate racemase family protein [Dethiosulfatarculus sandiegensis]|uniref:Aspartate racemase n=1 Tax=Dethiosulfatarculus sandiegensis TaxID=1429043 RepID=A0A0D2JRR7_9BACT|nr:aspartate/glutamate racemase family protein [Dethiosulfatarculus sandiegensis]KIX12210.1 aspartate racemase [Dethiosulfatarculus sandiegensis]